VEKYCRSGQATEDNTAHAHCMLYTCGYKYKLRICNTFQRQQWLHECASLYVISKLFCCTNEYVTSRGEPGAGEYGKLLISYVFLHAHFFPVIEFESRVQCPLPLYPKPGMYSMWWT
jgi:hypothetical protein